MQYKISVDELTGGRRYWEKEVDAEDSLTAIDRGVKALYGKHAWFWSKKLGDAYYGQIMKDLKDGQGTATTLRHNMRIRATRLS